MTGERAHSTQLSPRRSMDCNLLLRETRVSISSTVVRAKNLAKKIFSLPKIHMTFYLPYIAKALASDLVVFTHFLIKRCLQLSPLPLIMFSRLIAAVNEPSNCLTVIIKDKTA
jgi:hypothetical protein